MKLASEKDLLEGRTRANRYLATPGSCDRCDGRGYFHDTNEECYCDCAAGELRKRLETSSKVRRGL